MPWWFAVVEARHDIQNPTSAEKIRLLGERIGLRPNSRVLDVASGRGGPAIVLAETFGCHLTCIERAQEFVDAARERVASAGLSGRIDIVHADAESVTLDKGDYDAALCLGASFVWGGLENTVARLLPTVRDDGFVVVGEPYWRTWPLPAETPRHADEEFTTLAQTAARFEACGLSLVGAISASEDDWDRYESLHWLALEEWLADNPDHPDAPTFAERGRQMKDAYLTWQRELLGWVILVGRRRAGAHSRPASAR